MGKKINSRRYFLYNMSLAAGGTVLFSSLVNCKSMNQKSTSHKNGVKKLGIALVGLGGYSSGQLGPALRETNNCYLAGIVTGTPSKESKWSEEYNIPAKNIYNYENFDTIAGNKDI